tara:strand:+ start:206 stop:382 length:177 start_codon:yes stop_codon:yes gene_type:complete
MSVVGAQIIPIPDGSISYNIWIRPVSFSYIISNKCYTASLTIWKLGMAVKFWKPGHPG